MIIIITISYKTFRSRKSNQKHDVIYFEKSCTNCTCEKVVRKLTVCICL